MKVARCYRLDGALIAVDENYRVVGDNVHEVMLAAAKTVRRLRSDIRDRGYTLSARAPFKEWQPTTLKLGSEKLLIRIRKKVTP